MTKPQIETAFANWLNEILIDAGRSERCVPGTNIAGLPAAGTYLVAICDEMPNVVGALHHGMMRLQVQTYALHDEDNDGAITSPADHSAACASADAAFTDAGKTALAAEIASETGDATLNGWHLASAWADIQDEEAKRFVSEKSIKLGLAQNGAVSSQPIFVRFWQYADLDAIEARHPAADNDGLFGLVDRGDAPSVVVSAEGAWQYAFAGFAP